MMVKVRWEERAEDFCPPAPNKSSHTPWEEALVSTWEETRSYTHVSRRWSSVVIILGLPNISTTSAEDIPTLISR